MLLSPRDQETPQPTSTLQALPEGPAGVAATLAQMRRWTKEYRTDPAIRAVAESIVASLPGKSYFAEAAAVQDYVRDTIRYTRDVYDVETLKTPPELLKSRFGDCDDMALLAGTLLQSIGHPVRYVAFAFESPDVFEHVYLETKIGTRWVGVECTEPMHLGWVPESPFPPMVRHV